MGWTPRHGLPLAPGAYPKRQRILTFIASIVSVFLPCAFFFVSGSQPSLIGVLVRKPPIVTVPIGGSNDWESGFVV